jgi:monolysocardiolipin acyltransferase
VRTGKCIPITRGGGIYQEHMNEALDVLRNGGWVWGHFFYNYVLIFLSATDAISPAYGFCPLFNSKIYHDIFKQLHAFPEGKIAQEDQPIRRLKWGTASLIVRAPITPIVLPIVHSGFEKVHGTDMASC